jgi:HK97 family phage major capsid protein
MKLAELREERGRVIKLTREILDKAEKENRDLTAEEQGKYDELFKQQEQIRGRIDREERLLEIEREAAKNAIRTDPAAPAPSNIPAEVRDAYGQRVTPEYRAAFAKFLREGRAVMSAEEVRALAADDNVGGGFTLAPQQFVTDLLKAVDDQVFIRPLATKFQVSGSQSLGAPALDADPADSDWTSELATGNEDTAMKFGKRELTPHPLAKRIKVSNKLLRMSALPIESVVRERLAYKFGITEEKGFLTGTGANQPLGVFTASANGISTGRDSLTGSATSITFDGLYDAKYKLKGNYWARARWLFHRDALKIISKLKDTQTRYLWEPSQKVGQPDMLLGVPVMMSEYVPNTFTTGKYVGMIADFSFYWIADSIDVAVQRLVELYAETNQTGFIARQEVDGMPALEEAFVRLKTD